MNPMGRFGLLLSLCMLALSSCGIRPEPRIASQLALNLTADDTASLLQKLRQANYNLPLKDLALPSQVARLVAESPVPLALTVPVHEHRALLDKPDDLLWVELPLGDDKELKAIVAHDRSGNQIELDPANPPARPTLVIASQESPLPIDNTNLVAATDDLLMLDKIHIADIQEPWVRGDAEVYAIVAYLDREGKGSTAVVPLNGVTKANTTYDLRKIIHYWPRNFYKLVDISIYEHDTHHNFQELTIALLDAAGKITSVALPGYGSIAALVSDLLINIIKALPKEWFEDADDHLDTFNTVERSIAQESRYGVAHNVLIELRRYQAERNE